MDWVKGLVGGGRTSGSGQRLGSSGPGGAYPGAAASASALASPRTPSTGGSVGGRSPTGLARQPSAPQVDVVEVTFTAEEKQLGMTLLPAGHPQGAAAVVGSVAVQGTAHRKGVRKGDRVVAVDGNPVRDFDALEATLAAIGRPVTFQLERQAAAMVAAPVGQGQGQMQAPLSPHDRERAARRAAMAAAAEERTKAWTKKIEGNRARDRASDDSRFRAASDPKTLESVARVKAAEQAEPIYQTHTYGQSQARARIELAQPAPGVPIPTNGGFPPSPPRGAGYNNGSPYAGAGAAPGGVPFPAPGVVAPPIGFGGGDGGGQGLEPLPIPPLTQEEVESPETIVAEEEFDSALSVLLDQPAERRQTALATAQQILTNALAQPFNEKFRRVKTSTNAFQSRLAGCPGGVELLTAAGFAFVEDEQEETYLAIVEPPPVVPLRARIVYHRLRQTVAHMQEM